MHKDIKQTPSVKFSTGSNILESEPQVNEESPSYKIGINMREDRKI